MRCAELPITERIMLGYNKARGWSPCSSGICWYSTAGGYWWKNRKAAG